MPSIEAPRMHSDAEIVRSCPESMAVRFHRSQPALAIFIRSWGAMKAEFRRNAGTLSGQNVQLLPGWNICEAKGARGTLGWASAGIALRLNAPRRKFRRVAEHSHPMFGVPSVESDAFFIVGTKYEASKRKA